MKSFTQFLRAAGKALLILAIFLSFGPGIKSALAQTFTATGLPQNIPDGLSVNCWVSPGTPLTSTIQVTGVSGNVVSLNQITVNLILSHSWIGDLSVSITPPGGSPVSLISRLGTGSCGSSFDFSSSNLLSFSGTNSASVTLSNPVPAGNYLPTAGGSGGTPGNMADLIGSPFNGDWVLTVLDGTTDDVGQLHFFSIAIDPTVCPPANVIYVKASATGANNGTSWADAFTDLQDALDSDCPGITEIWVAAGTYKPTTGTDRNISFVMKNNVAIYGGFEGTEDPLTFDLADRDFVAYETILSGDIGVPEDINDNSFNIIKNGNATDNTAILDGFTLTGGNTSGASFPHFYGGAINNDGRDGFCNPVIRNCIFYGNTASGGGAIANRSDNGICSIAIINCLFYYNQAIHNGHLSNGGAFYAVGGGQSTIINSTFFNNHSNGQGGGLYLTSNFGSPTVTLSNSIVWSNFAVNAGNQISAVVATINFSNNILEGGLSGIFTYNATLNENGLLLTDDPNFVDPDNDNLRLQACSPAIDAGDNNFVPVGIENDLDGNPRVFNSGTVDMGAYEYQGEKPTNPTDSGEIAANQTVCIGGTPDPFISVSPASGHIGNLEYQWQNSTTSPTFVDIPGAASETYTHTGTVTQTTWFRRLARVTCETVWVESNIITVSVEPLPTAFVMPITEYITNGGFVTHPGLGAGGADVSMASINPNTAGSNVLFPSYRIADDFQLTQPQSISQITTYAYQTNANNPGWTSFNMNLWNGRPGDQGSVIIASTTNATFSSTGIYRVFNGVSNLLNTSRLIQEINWSFSDITLSAGTYWIDWQITGGTTAWANYVMQPNGLNPNDPITVSGNARQYSNPAWQDLIADNTVQTETPFKVKVNGGGTICSNDSYTVSGASAANGTILWSHNGNGSLSGETTLTPTYNAAAGDAGNTVTLTLTVTGIGTCSSTTATAFHTITVEACCTNPTTGGAIAADHTICYGDTPAAFTSASLPTGVTGTLEYQWQLTAVSSTASFDDWEDVGTNTDTYTHPGTLTQATWFRRLARVECDPVGWASATASNVVEVTIDQLPTATAQNNTVYLNPYGTYNLTTDDVLSAHSDDFTATADIAVSFNPASFTCAHLGQTILVTVTVTDACGNSTVVYSYITVQEGSGLPAPWVNINTHASANGTATFAPCDNDGTFRLTATGQSTTTNDVFHFVHQQLCGNGTIIARLADVQNGGYAGVMMRESNHPAAKTVLFKTLLYNPNVLIGTRTSQGQAMRNASQVAQLIRWMKIQRNGNNFRVFTSYNGTTWQQRYSGNITMNSCIQAGIFTESVRSNRTSIAWFDHVEVVDFLKSHELTTLIDQPKEEQGDVLSIEVYPNPASDRITIGYPFTGQPVKLTVSNPESQIVLIETIRESETQLNVQSLKPGIWFLKFETEERVVVRKLIIQ